MSRVIDEGTQDVLEFQLINRLNGEMVEIKIDNAWDAKQKWLELQQVYKMTGDAIDKIKTYLDNFLGEDEQYQFVDGTYLKRVQRENVSWRLEALREFLDADQLDVCLAVNKTTAKKLLQEMIESGDVPGNAIKTLDEKGERTATKPYVTLV